MRSSLPEPPSSLWTSRGSRSVMPSGNASFRMLAKRAVRPRRSGTGRCAGSGKSSGRPHLQKDEAGYLPDASTGAPIACPRNLATSARSCMIFRSFRDTFERGPPLAEKSKIASGVVYVRALGRWTCGTTSDCAPSRSSSGCSQGSLPGRWVGWWILPIGRRPFTWEPCRGFFEQLRSRRKRAASTPTLSASMRPMMYWPSVILRSRDWTLRPQAISQSSMPTIYTANS